MRNRYQIESIKIERAFMKTAMKFILHTVILFAALLVVAFLTRIPALGFIGIYAFHAVLVALFNAAILAFYLRRTANMVPVIVAVALLAAFLATMQLLMGLGFLLPLIVSLVFWVLLSGNSVNKASVATAALFAALPYPTLVLLAAITGSLAGIDPLTFITWLFVSCGLGLAGALIGVLIGQKTKPTGGLAQSE